MDDELVWRGIREANPWWASGSMPADRTRAFRRDAFDGVLAALRGAERGRGVTLLGPRRVGKSVLLHQLVDALLAEGAAPEHVVMLPLDDVALRGADLGRLLDLVLTRVPVGPDVERWLLLDEVQHAPAWAGWLKRIADRRDPWRFFATGSSATALRHGGQDAGLGRWRELTLYPWSFREHVRFRAGRSEGASLLMAFERSASERGVDREAPPDHPFPWDRDEAARLDEILLDYLVLGGFPEVLEHADTRAARRHLRQDILDRAMGRDVVDVESVDTRALERMFLRICQNPGGLWNASEVANDLQLSRPTVARYLGVLERAFLAFALPNLGSPVKGQSKVYLVAPSLRSALLHIDHEGMREPTTWGPAIENLVAATLVATRDVGSDVGFWRQGGAEVDGVVRGPSGAWALEVKSGRKRDATRNLARAATALSLDPATSRAVVLVRDPSLCGRLDVPGYTGAATVHVAQWLWSWQPAYGGAARVPLD